MCDFIYLKWAFLGLYSWLLFSNNLFVSSFFYLHIEDSLSLYLPDCLEPMILWSFFFFLVYLFTFFWSYFTYVLYVHADVNMCTCHSHAAHISVHMPQTDFGFLTSSTPLCLSPGSHNTWTLPIWLAGQWVPDVCHCARFNTFSSIRLLNVINGCRGSELGPLCLWLALDPHTHRLAPLVLEP